MSPFKKLMTSRPAASVGAFAVLPLLCSLAANDTQCAAKAGAMRGCSAVYTTSHSLTPSVWVGIALAILANAFIFKDLFKRDGILYVTAFVLPFVTGYFSGKKEVYEVVDKTMYIHEWSIAGIILGAVVSAGIVTWLFYDSKNKKNAKKRTTTSTPTAEAPAELDIKPYIELITARGARSVEEVTSNFLFEAKAALGGELPYANDETGTRACPLLMFGYNPAYNGEQLLTTLFVETDGNYVHMISDGSVQKSGIDPQDRAGMIAASLFAKQRVVLIGGRFTLVQGENLQEHLITVLASTLRYINTTGIPPVLYDARDLCQS